MSSAPGPRVSIDWVRLGADTERFVITPAERARADTYRRQADRARSLLAAGLLRAAVARETGLAPAEVRVDRTCNTCGEQHGRPVVAVPAAPAPHVSVTHAGEWVGVAVSPRVPVGLDVEAWCDAAATPPEIAAAGERTDALARLWVAKEAALKAVGHGFTVDPTAVVLTRALCRVRRWPFADDPTRTAIRSVDPDADHAAAVCALDAAEPELTVTTA